jgi:ATP-dependent Clp protease ATP-binding subunit ClpC
VTPALDDLLALSRQVFAHGRLTMSRLLSAWAADDATGALAAIVEPAGVTCSRLVLALQPFTVDDREDDFVLLNSCLGAEFGRGMRGWHLLKALCENPDHALVSALGDCGLNLEQLRDALAAAPPVAVPILAEVLAKHASPAHVLERYGRNLTQLASSGAFVDLEERTADVERLEDVLQKKQTGNAALTGEPGVGKTAIVELLARRIAEGQVPASLLDCSVFEVCLGRVVAGTRYRGDFEERLGDIVAAAQSMGKVILFLDEFHTVIGAGRAEGVIMDAAQILKPALGRGEVRVVGATTVEEYQHIRRDEALARRFEEVRVTEPESGVLIAIVTRQAVGLQHHHGLAIEDALILESISLTDLHVSNRRQPAKAVSALDSACVLAARAGRMTVEYADLLEAVSRLAGVNLGPGGGGDRLQLRTLPTRLAQRVIGQADALGRIASVLAYRSQAVGSDARCKGVFLFAGSTGVGKTETARAIAAEYFGSPKALLVLDMGEYAGAGGIEKLLGSPPGYAGSEREGVLARWLQERVAGVVCFDEIEKADASMLSVLLGILDGGRARTGRGEPLDLRNCVIVATTNALRQDEVDQPSMGFRSRDDGPDVAGLLEKHFPREWLSRFDELIVFGALSRQDLRDVLKLRLCEAVARLKARNCELDYDEDRLLDWLSRGLEKEKAGARGVARCLEQMVIQPVSLALILLEPGDLAHFLLDDEFYASGVVKRVLGA